MIRNNICYLYFTGSQNTYIRQSSPLQHQGQYHVSSQRCHPMLLVSSSMRLMRVLQFHFTHCTYFLTSIYCCEVVPHLNRFSFHAALIALSCLCPTKLAHVFNWKTIKIIKTKFIHSSKA